MARILSVEGQGPVYTAKAEGCVARVGLGDGWLEQVLDLLLCYFG